MNLKQKSVMFLATGCFIGNISFAPGTFGSILGLPLCFLFSKTNLLIAVFLIVIFIFSAIWIAREAEKILNTEDPGCVVIDEIAGILFDLSKEIYPEAPVLLWMMWRRVFAAICY